MSFKEKDLENHLEAEGEPAEKPAPKKTEKTDKGKTSIKDAEARVGPLKVESLQTDNQVMRALEILMGHDVLKNVKG